MRRDIQFLRGVAVLVVVLYHAGFSPVRNGFLGVDIFFVISGFLITAIIFRGLDSETFSFRGFYLRRARRLLPALYCTLIFTTVIACVLLTPRQLQEYAHQLAGAVTFSANMVLPFQVGYFEDAAETKPLLHIWSLSLEEQYYFLLPLLLLLVPARHRFILLCSSIVASFTLCFIMVTYSLDYFGIPNRVSSEWAFFLFPTRAWELLAGSLLAWTMLSSPSVSIPPSIKHCALLALLLVLFFSIDNVHPRGDALFAVIATMVMIVGRDDWLPNNWITRAIEKTGDWSYSLYLVHWPLFAFSQVVFLGAVPATTRFLLVLLSIILAYLQYEFVEQRFHRGLSTVQSVSLKKLVLASVLVLILPIVVFYGAEATKKSADSAGKDFRRGAWGLHSTCSEVDRFGPPERCMTSTEPTVAVWGDSFGMHLVHGLLKEPDIADSLVQLTKSNCAPILEIAPVSDSFSEAWASNCIDFNNNALEYIRSSESIEFVILSSPFNLYFKESGDSFLYQGKVVPHTASTALEQMAHTIDEIRRLGKTPVIVAPPPGTRFNIGECLNRYRRNLLVFGRPNCDFLLSDAKLYQQEVRTALAQIAETAAIKVYSFDDLICESNKCSSKIENTYIYRDAAHLSKPGSELLVPKLRLTEHLIENSL